MRSILVHSDIGQAGNARLDSALSLARMTRGHVTLLVETPITRFTAIDGIGGSYVDVGAIREAVAADDELAAELDRRVAHEDVCCDVLRAQADPIDACMAAALLADVVVLSRAEALASDLPLAVRCPVLAVNEDRPLCFPLKTAMIAWDGGLVAAQALRAAVPLLAGAEEVFVVTVDEAPAGFPPTEALSYLSRHGVSAELQVLAKRDSVQATLAGQAQHLGADLLVMGAFGHSRLRELLFGGVSRYFLSAKDGPALLMAH